MNLRETIIEKIKEKGPISFRTFMEMALYYPGLGYYTSEKEKFGKEGDYYTSPILSKLYGQMLGKQMEEMWHHMGKKPFTIIEYGAGNGNLCSDILSYLKNNPELFDNLHYYIIEKSSTLKAKQQLLLKEKVAWLNNISELNGFDGCVFSNEVLDNMAVHAVVMQKELMEVFVDADNGFKETLLPASAALQNYLAEQGVVLPENYRTEINLEALDYIKDIAAQLKRGYLMTIDYGYLSNEYFSEAHRAGTLACYFKHTVTDRIYQNIGEQDITAHVNFSALNIGGNKHGLDFAGYCNQNYFLRSLGLAGCLRNLETEMKDKGMLFQINKLLLEMGSKFKVLIQQKGLPLKPLSGMQFSRKLP